MTPGPGFRKLALTAHLTSSVGWLGSDAAFLALAIAGVASQDGQVVRAAYVAMQLITWFVIVPLSLASFGTGSSSPSLRPGACFGTIGWWRSWG